MSLALVIMRFWDGNSNPDPILRLSQSFSYKCDFFFSNILLFEKKNPSLSQA